jgi:hypothetical protein
MNFRAALLFAGATLGANAETCPKLRSVRVELALAVPLDPASVAAAKEEAGWILRSLCMDVEWAPAPAAGHFLIRILPNPLTPDSTSDALGMAMPGLRRGALFLGRIRERAEMYRSRIGFATLLGSVLAHEIGHLLLGTTAHSREGVMRPDFRKPEIDKAAQRQLLFTASDRLGLPPS